jgi:hypothetical protein
MKQQNRTWFILLLVVFGIIMTKNYAGIKIEATPKASKTIEGKPWPFELYNKSKREIMGSLKTMTDKMIFQNKLIPTGGFIRAFYDDAYVPLELTIGQTHFEINPTGKTVYLSFSDQKGLYPQTGVWMGILDKTESGLNNKNNIEQSAIKKMIYKQTDLKQQPKTPAIPKPPVTTYLPGESLPRQTETTTLASSGKPWRFELRNPTAHTVTFSLEQMPGRKTILKNIVLPPNSAFRAIIDTNTDFILSTVLTLKIPGVLKTFIGEEKKSSVQTRLSPKGKTMYVEVVTALDPTSYKIIPAPPGYPKEKTFSGLSRENNISREQIR